MMTFDRIEKKLRDMRNATYISIYEESTGARDKRLMLVTAALDGEDEECLQAMAEIFESPRAGFMNFIYW